MTAKQIEEIRARAKKATKGPWQNGLVMCGDDHVTAVLDADGDEICNMGQSFLYEEANADFIAAAKEDVPALLTDNDALRKRIEKLERVANWARAMSNTVGDPFVPNAMLHAALPRLIGNIQAELEGLDALASLKEPVKS